MAKIRVGLVGCGFAAELHMHAYRPARSDEGAPDRV